MKSSSCLRYLLAVLVLGTVMQVTVAEVLEDSGFPMTGVNPQRNYQTNRPVLCSRPPGRSQVLNLKWTFQPPTEGTYVYNPYGATIDSEGNAYIMVLDVAGYQFVKLNGTDGTVIKTFNLAESVGYSSPTLLQGNKMYFATQLNTYILNTTDLSIGPGIPNTQGVDVPNLQLSYAPYLGTHMVASNEATSALAPSESLMYIRASDQSVDSTKFNIAAGRPLPVLIYKDSTNEFPIVVSYSGLAPNFIVRLNSPNYAINVTDPGEIVYRAWIEGNSLYLFTKGYVATNTVKIYSYNARTGVLNNVQTIAEFQGSAFTLQSDVYAANNISVAQIYNTAAAKRQVVDLINGRVLLQEATEMRLHSAPVFSIPDNTMLMHVSAPGGRAEIVGVDWNTLEVNTRGIFPVVASDYIMGSSMIGENCHVYTSVNGRYFYALAPVPILEIVPIFECVNQDGVAYFSYENLGDLDAIIPQLFDRNNLSPLNVTPGVEFGANRRGKYFPLSFRVNFGTTGTFTWQLEDYVLTVTLNASLVCPQTVRFNIVLTADDPFPSTFRESVRLLFATLAGINETRVSFTIPLPKRSIEQSSVDLELELQVAPPDAQSTEPTAEQAIQTFVEDQLDTFNGQLSGLPDAPANVTTKDVDGVPLETQISGEIPPPLPPTTAPVTQPTTPTTTPITTTSSSIIISVPIVALVSCIFITVI
eukprot:TRINITY_DN1569_c0_g2_i1.p1 TRINITY_DN1569_c0_g2~~TRINITY_DN1569_c0_g2_i1.p1  ORF type:complete len:710 (+),score=83.21 TRINITY_DN1569_c0_g2_i1:32-2131(+)